MRNFIKHFVRERAGVWVCAEPATWDGPPRIQVTPGARFARGRMFMGVDLAKLLDEQYEKNHRP